MCIAVLSALLLTVVCATHDESVVVDEEWSRPDKKVTNGRVYDVATLDIGGHTTLRVPMGSEVIHSVEHGTVNLFMEKSLFFVGFPPKPIDLLTARRSMGCAWKTDASTLIVGTFGEWNSHIEGGAAIALRIVVPKDLVVEFSETLSGESSIAARQDPLWWLSHRASDPNYWYAADVPATGWTAVPSAPDPSKAASGVNTG